MERKQIRFGRISYHRLPIDTFWPVCLSCPVSWFALLCSERPPPPKLFDWHTAGLSLSLLRCAALVRLIARSGFSLATKVKAAKVKFATGPLSVEHRGQTWIAGIPFSLANGVEELLDLKFEDTSLFCFFLLVFFYFIFVCNDGTNCGKCMCRRASSYYQMCKSLIRGIEFIELDLCHRKFFPDWRNPKLLLCQQRL